MSYQEERDENRQANKVVELKLITRVPSKYRVIDLETGDVWQAAPEDYKPVNGKPYTGWIRATDIQYALREPAKRTLTTIGAVEPVTA